MRRWPRNTPTRRRSSTTLWQRLVTSEHPPLHIIMEELESGRHYQLAQLERVSWVFWQKRANRMCLFLLSGLQSFRSGAHGQRQGQPFEARLWIYDEGEGQDEGSGQDGSPVNVRRRGECWRWGRASTCEFWHWTLCEHRGVLKSEHMAWEWQFLFIETSTPL